MLRQARSTSRTSNPLFTPLERWPDESNTQWGERAVVEMDTGGSKDWTYVVLLGGSDTLAFRLRIAQSQLRSDMLPSFWSEAILVELKANSVAGARAIHVPLIQPEGPDFSTRNNGVVVRPLRDFDDTGRYPNIALIALPVAQSKILEAVDRFRKSRSTLDALEHVLRWLAFAWGAARTPNPLHDNFGLPSASMLETVCAAANLDLTPGLEARVSCPEAIWVAARYWQDFFEHSRGHAPIGRYWAPHRYPIVEPGAGDGGGSKPARAPRRKSGRK